MSRPIRKITPTFKIFCEGDTEYNYFEGLRQNSSFSITIKTIDMSGGGYSNFLNRLKSDSNTNCIGKIIVIDGDKIATDEGEKRQFLELLQFCQNQNKPVGGKKSTRIPYILVVNYEDFEYVACLHNKYYKGTGRSSSFITGTFKYKTIDEFKKDKKVYQFLTKNGTSEKDANSIENMIEAVMKRPKIVSNSILDTKWKRLTENERKNYGISQADMYQMYAYSKKYQTPEIWLLYPVNECIAQHDNIRFDSGDGVCVSVYLVDLANIEDNLFKLKEQVETTGWKID